VERIDSLGLGNVGRRHGGLHRSVWRRFVAVSGNVPAARAERNGFATAQVGYVDKSVIVTAENVGYSPL
jgi:hypothetical protein